MRNSKHVKAMPITSEQHHRDQLFKGKTTNTPEDILKQSEDTNLTVTETS